MAEEKMVDIIEFTFLGKDYQILPKDFDKVEKQLLGDLGFYIKSLSTRMKINMRIYEDYTETGILRNGFLKAVSKVVVLTVGQVKLPDPKYAANATAALSRLERAKGSLVQLNDALPEAEAAINAFTDAMLDFLAGFGTKAKGIGTTLKVASAAGFVVLGAMGASVLVAGGLSVAAAAAASATAVSVLQSSADNLGRAATGQEVDLWQSVKDAVLSGAVAGATAGIGGKLPTKFIGDQAKALAPKIASKLTGGSAFNTKAMTPYIERYLSGTGEAVGNEAVKQAVETVGKMVKSGKVPTEKDLMDACESILTAALTGGMVKNLNAFHTKWVYDSKSLIEVKLLPEVLRKLTGGKPLEKVQQAKVVADVVKAVSDDYVGKGVEAVLDATKGDEDASKMAAVAEKAVQGDSKLNAMLIKEVEKAMKKNKVK